jgi:hypothetical protein
VIKITKKFVETVHRRQVFIPVAYVILAKLARRITKVLKKAADRRIKLAHAHG